MSDTLFSSDLHTSATRHLGRQWLGDLLDLLLSVLLGWGLLRALDVTRTPGRLIALGAGVWFVMSALGGWSGWTPGRGLVGLRLMGEGRRLGVPRGAVRMPLAVVELFLSPILQRRSFDGLLGARVESVPPGNPSWRGGVPWLGAWLVLVMAAGWFMRAPTRTETLHYLKTLDGWRCCHGQQTPSPAQCEEALGRAAREATHGDALAQTVVAECPSARGP